MIISGQAKDYLNKEAPKTLYNILTKKQKKKPARLITTTARSYRAKEKRPSQHRVKLVMSPQSMEASGRAGEGKIAVVVDEETDTFFVF